MDESKVQSRVDEGKQNREDVDYIAHEMDRLERLATEEDTLAEPEQEEQELYDNLQGAAKKNYRFNAATANTIILYVKRGAPISTAAAAAGITHKTLNTWLKEGRAGRTKQRRDFYLAMNQAVAEAEMDLVRNIRDAGEDKWQANAWLLERQNPEQWGRTRLGLGGPNQPSSGQTIHNYNLTNSQAENIWKSLHQADSLPKRMMEDIDVEEGSSIEIPLEIEKSND